MKRVKYVNKAKENLSPKQIEELCMKEIMNDKKKIKKILKNSREEKEDLYEKIITIKNVVKEKTEKLEKENIELKNKNEEYKKVINKIPKFILYIFVGKNI